MILYVRARQEVARCRRVILHDCLELCGGLGLDWGKIGLAS